MTDWPTMIRDIQRLGRLRLIDIAAECDTSEGTISDILYRRTKQPRWALGDSLHALHKRVVPRDAGNSAVRAEKTA